MDKRIIPIACDHAGYDLKLIIIDYLKKNGFEIIDYGTDSADSVDYPDLIHPIAADIDMGKYWRGIIICGSGNGVSMTANKYPNVRAALSWNKEIAEMGRLHNDANILSLPARYIDTETAKEIVDIFLVTEFEGGRHERRVKKINKS